MTGRNLQLVEKITKLNPWSTSNNRLKHALAAAEQVEVPVQIGGTCQIYVLFYLREEMLITMPWKMKRKYLEN